MKEKLKGLGLGGGLAAAMLFAMDLPAVDFTHIQQDWDQADLFKSCMVNVEKDCRAWATAGGGGEMPRGLSRDTKVELGIGERYALTGTIEVKRDLIYLRVDLKKQPWLANRARVKNPYYRISGDQAPWRKYIGRPVTVIVVARYNVLVDRGRPILEIYLEPGPNPVIEDAYRNRR